MTGEPRGSCGGRKRRRAASWYLLWTDRFVELSASAVFKDSAISHLFVGEQAIDALGRIAPVCTVHQWFYFDLLREVDPAVLSRARAQLDHDPTVPHTLGKFVVGAAFAEVLRQFGPGACEGHMPKGPPDADAFHATLVKSATRGFASSQAYFAGLLEGATQIVCK